MESKIMHIFYGADNLPYKDHPRTVHFPIVGQAFMGASNTTEIRFYTDKIGSIDATYISIAKLPNGKVGTKILTKGYDAQIDENYVSLKLSNFYTQAKGDLYISLNGYEGGVELRYNEETQLYEIYGTPTIQATGSVKIAINYATQYIGDGTEETITLQEIYALFGNKLDKDSPYYIKAIDDISDINRPILAPYLKGNQIVYSKSDNVFYRIVENQGTLSATKLPSAVDCIKLDGSTPMQGNLDLANNNISNVNDIASESVHSTSLLVDNITSKSGIDISVAKDINMQGNKIKNVAEPILAQDVATKNYVDEHSGKGKVVDVKINGNSILDSNKVANIELKNSLDNATNNDIASALATKNAIDNVREVAEGKTNSYALFVSQNAQFDSKEEYIYVDSFVDVSGNTIQVRDLKSGDVIYTVDNENSHYLDRFVITTGDNVLGAINADMPDLQNYYKKDENLIPGVSGLNIGSGSKVFGTTYTQNLNDGVNSVSVGEISKANNLENGSGLKSIQGKIQDGKETFNTNVDGQTHTSGASGDYSAVFGGVGESSGKRSSVFGGYNVATGNNTFIAGEANKASARTATAFGSHTQASAEEAFSTGIHTIASGMGSFTTGQLTVASGNRSFAIGLKTEASGNEAFSSGIDSKATGEASFAEGSSKSLADFAHAEGDQTEAKGKRSHTEGCMTKTLNEAEDTGGSGGEGSGGSGGETVPPTVPDDYVPEYGFSAHAEGFNTIASGSASHAEGNSTKSSGHNSHAEGLEAVAKGYASHAQGYKTKALGDYSFASGRYAEVSGNSSAGIGGYVNVSGNNSVGIGYSNTVNGDYHYAIGVGLFIGPGAPKGAIHLGSYAVSDNNTLFTIGNGDSSARSSAFTVYQDGHAEIKTMGSSNNSVATKEYVDSKSASGGGGGTKLYKHMLLGNYGQYTIYVVSAQQAPYNSSLVDERTILSAVDDMGHYGYISLNETYTDCIFKSFDGSVTSPELISNLQSDTVTEL